MLNTQRIDHVVLYEENGCLCYRLAAQYRKLQLICGGAFITISIVGLVYVAIKKPFRELTDMGPWLETLVINSAIVFALAMVFALSYFAKASLQPAVIDKIQDRISFGMKSRMSLVNAEAVSVRVNPTSEGTDYSIAIRFKSAKRKRLERLSFDNLDSAKAVADRIAIFLALPVEFV
jgi:hypothetical protein